ncbi:FAD-dependent oxidoreductase [Streptomyces niveiscabiei]|nr:FAD-dependent oxidoreductase [Streptomyces niveiscabiei]MDX3384664.1 FAD-dependent oxidoreductase [Streptomyces niveiscabiei]
MSPLGRAEGGAVARVLVVGGGIAGAAAALALDRAGLDVEVFEAHPDAAEDIGAFLTLASNGMRALREIGTTEAVTAIGFPLRSIRLLESTGAEAAHAPMGEAADPALNFRCLRREELAVALQKEAVRRGIPIRYGARLTHVEEQPGAVTAHFADGATATGGLLLGADGLNSVVRQAVAPDARPAYAGQYVFYGYTTDAGPAAETDCFTMVRGSAAAFGFACSPDGETYWFARVGGDPLTAERIEEGTPEGWRELLVPLLREDDTPAAGLVAATPGRLMVTNATELPVGMPWRSGRTLVLGDAAHAASPATGQGASMALEDAVVLAKCLRDLPDTDAALDRYEALRRPRVEHNIVASGAMSRGTYNATDANGRPVGKTRPGDDTLAELLDWEADITDIAGIGDFPTE